MRKIVRELLHTAERSALNSTQSREQEVTRHRRWEVSGLRTGIMPCLLAAILMFSGNSTAQEGDGLRAEGMCEIWVYPEYCREPVIVINGVLDPDYPVVVDCDEYVSLSAWYQEDCTFLYWQLPNQWLPYANIWYDNAWVFQPGSLGFGNRIYISAVYEDNAPPPLRITRQPQGARLYQGQSYRLSVQVEDGFPPYRFIWEKDSHDIGANLPYYEILAASSADEGVYRCEVSDRVRFHRTEYVNIEVFARASSGFHHADTNQDWLISIHELLRVIQFFNVGGYHCAVSTEDGFAPGPGDDSCAAHHGDYDAQDWQFSLSEILRIVQYFNSPGGAYHAEAGTEDGFGPQAG